MKVSVGDMSRDLGCLVRGLSLAQARDWRVRLTSASAEVMISLVDNYLLRCVGQKCGFT